MANNGTGRMIGGRYEIEGAGGSDGTADVYHAQDRQLQRPVVIKMLRPEWAAQPGTAARFQRDAEAAARLQHPHLAQVYDYGVEAGRPYIVMERGPGTPLDRFPRPDVSQAVAIAAQIAGALAAVHENGLVHCDVQPANVLVDAQGQAKLINFGAACPPDAPAAGQVVYRPAGAAQPPPSRTLDPAAAPYLAPERLAGAPPNPAADVYGLGAVLYGLLGGRPPYPGATPDAVRQAQQAGPPPPLPQLNPAVPPGLDRLVSRAIALDPVARFASAGELAAALSAIHDQSRQATSAFVPVPGPAPTPAASVVQRGAPKWALPAAAGAGLLALLVLLAFLLKPPTDPGVLGGLATAISGPTATAANTPPAGTVTPVPSATAASTSTAAGAAQPPPQLSTSTPLPLPAALTPTGLPTLPTAAPTPTSGIALSPVPKLTGLLLAEATKRASAGGWVLHAVSGDYSTTVQRGRVLTQQPAAGTPLARGAPIRVTYSRGPPPAPQAGDIQNAQGDGGD